MNPWDIIGWAIVVGILFILGLALLSDFIKVWSNWRAYHKTKHIEPQEGQSWEGVHGDIFRILAVTEKSVYWTSPMGMGRVSAGDTREEWANRMVRYKLRLIGGGTAT